ncbi:MAG: PilZ domain-containing protein [Novosphingobium sp.]|jgi:hypothetical protein|nr:PilZ domain-containing protein [Brevundimonas sp.]
MSRNEIQPGQELVPSHERARRATTLFVVSCQRANGVSASLKVRNLSATGLKAECPEVADFALNEEVMIAFRNLTPVAAQVIRFEGAEVGFKFRNPVDPDRINRARTMQQEPAKSPRSDAVGNWITNHTKRQEWERLAKGIRGPRAI